jgi:tetratricopeptide (TPR) repeat protein
MGYSSRIFPLEAARWLSEQRISGPAVFVDFSASSNLLPWLDHRFKLLVDTNTFAYDDQWFKQIMDVSAGRLDHRTLFDRHHVNIALMHFESGTEPLIQALSNDAEWTLAYVDPHAVIFLRRIPEHVAILKDHRPTSNNIDIEARLKSVGGLRYHRALSIATMGAVPFTLGWYEAAARLYDEALRLAPDSAAVWNHLGLCHGNLAHDAHRAGKEDRARRHLSEAIRCFNEAVALEPGDREARTNLSKAEELLRSIH